MPFYPADDSIQVILLVWFCVDSPRMAATPDSQVYCGFVSGTLKTVMSSLLTVHAALLLTVTLLLAFATREVDPMFNESKHLTISALCGFIVCIVGFVVTVQSTNAIVNVAVEISLPLGLVIVYLACYIIPPLYRVMRAESSNFATISKKTTSQSRREQGMTVSKLDMSRNVATSKVDIPMGSTSGKVCTCFGDTEMIL